MGGPRGRGRPRVMWQRRRAQAGKRFGWRRWTVMMPGCALEIETGRLWSVADVCWGGRDGQRSRRLPVGPSGGGDVGLLLLHNR